MGVIIVVGSVMAVLKTVINHTEQIMEHGSAEVNGIPIIGRKKTFDSDCACIQLTENNSQQIFSCCVHFI